NDEPDWDAMFASQLEPSTGAGERMTRGGETPPPSRRARRASGGTSRGGKRWIAWLVALPVVLGLGGGAVAFVWLNFEEQVRKVMGWEIPPADYEGAGTGETTIVIVPGDTGGDVANALLEADVIASYEAFWELLLKEEPQFHPGN